jgi:acetyl-CoA carboxylase/biotin carboxylase 1
MGIPLSNIKDIRILYGLTPTGTTPIDFEFSKPESELIQRRPMARGHVIAARITAENPDAGFKPNSGKFLELNFKSHSNVWGYFSVNATGGVHEYADSQFGHLFAYGSSRDEARKSLIMALKEISIRGDFRTTVEYLVKLLETDTFSKNVFTTSWLDKLISGEAPEKMSTSSSDADVVAALCGGFAKTFVAYQNNSTNYMSLLEKGKVPGNEYLCTKFDQDFIINSVHYKMKVFVHGNEHYSIVMGDAKLNVVGKGLADNGILVLFGGKSHVVYIKEEPVGSSLLVDGITYTMEKEVDPSQLRSPSPGKLIRYMVNDGEYLKAGEAFAEIEVMKMYMPLISKASGVFTSLKPVSSVLSNGDLIGVLKLDHTNHVPKAIPFNGTIPIFEVSDLSDEKPHHALKAIRVTVDSIMNGFEAAGTIGQIIDSLIRALKCQSLPMYEFREALGAISSRIPPNLAEYLYVKSSVNEGNEFIEQIPTIISFIRNTVDDLPLDDQDLMDDIVKPLIDVLNRYQNGVNSNANQVLFDLLAKYYKFETLFETSTTARVLLRLRELHRNDLSEVMDIARSLLKPDSRSEVVLRILDYIEKIPEVKEQKRYTDLLTNFTRLNSKSASRVAYRAREILIGFEIPSFLQRREIILNIFEKVIKKSGKRVLFNFNRLSKLIHSKYSILDIIPGFFYHPDLHMRAVALYAYIMRINQAYTVTSYEHHFFDDSVTISWDFDLLEQSFFEPTNDNRDASFLFDVTGSKSRKIRKGVIFMCETLEEVVPQVKRLEEMLPELGFPADEEGKQYFSCYATVALKPIGGLGVSDKEALKILQPFVLKHCEFYKAHNMQRVTFMILREDSHPRYFTFKASRDFLEDSVIRHIDPFMTYRLELERLANFDVNACSVEAKGLRIYHAVGKNNSSDIRFFTRGIIHPKHVTTFHDFFISEGIRITNDVLDSLELLTISYPNTDCNHVLLHFIPVFNLTKEQVHGYLEMLIKKNLDRLTKLRITEVEICYMGYHPNTSKVVPFRYIIDIKSQFVVHISAYSQEKDANGELKLVSLSQTTGPAHGLPVYRLHAPKQAIQPKRYKAHLLGTAYVYDFPALFNEALRQVWKEHKLCPPENLTDCIELALTANGSLEETSRLPGNVLHNDRWKYLWNSSF